MLSGTTTAKMEWCLTNYAIRKCWGKPGISTVAATPYLLWSLLIVICVVIELSAVSQFIWGDIDNSDSVALQCVRNEWIKMWTSQRFVSRQAMHLHWMGHKLLNYYKFLQRSLLFMYIFIKRFLPDWNCDQESKTMLNSNSFSYKSNPRIQVWLEWKACVCVPIVDSMTTGCWALRPHTISIFCCIPHC